tara:strand:+ start:167 stop:1075 length:909 start_codon:yes stop_codon:yes gene_type:complete
MPSNIEHANISALKLGTADVTKGYIGHEEVYPNTKEIQSIAFADTSTVPNTGATRVLNIGGEIGSTFTLTGANGASSPGAQSLSSTSEAFNISIGSNSSYGASSRTPSITIATTGSTTLASGVPTSRTLTQAAGPSVSNISINGSVSVSNLVNNTTVVNGITRWANGASFRVTHSFTTNGNIPWSFLTGSTSAQARAWLQNISTAATYATQTNHSVGSYSGTYYWSTSGGSLQVWYLSRINSSLPSGNLPSSFNAQYDMTLTNDANPTYMQFQTIWVPTAGYSLNGSGAGVADTVSSINHYP